MNSLRTAWTAIGNACRRASPCVDAATASVAPALLWIGSAALVAYLYAVPAILAYFFSERVAFPIAVAYDDYLAKQHVTSLLDATTLSILDWVKIVRGLSVLVAVLCTAAVVQAVWLVLAVLAYARRIKIEGHAPAPVETTPPPAAAGAAKKKT